MIRTTRISLRRLAALCSLLSLLGIALLFSPHRTISGKGNSLSSVAQRPPEPPLPPQEAPFKGRRRTGQNSVPRPLAAGGPDAFGYTFITNQPPPPTVPFSFIDISGGTPIVLGSGDDVSFTATLLQQFSFYGASYTQLQVSTNGYISTDLTDPGSDFTNDCPLPTPPSSGGGGRIYPLHGDLILNAPGGRILQQFFNACPRPNDINGAAEACTVIMWDNAEFAFGPEGTFDFEVILYHTTNEIVVQIAAGNPDDGAQTTTGIQNPPATSGLTVACNMANSIPDPFAVAFIPPCPTITCPANITQANDPGQCNAVVNYSLPTGNMCGPIVCNPPSGSTFNVGTTTVTCRATNTSACNTAYGLTTNNELVTFNVATPGTVSAPIPILGLGAGENVVGIDFRPANGTLYGVAVASNGTTARLLTIDPASGTTAQVGATFTVSGTNFGVDFNPMADRLRLVSDTDINLSINPNDGVATTQTALNPGNPTVVGSAYTNNFAGTTSTTLYGIDSGADTLVTQTPPASGTLATVGNLGVGTTGSVGFDISQCTGTAYATLTSEALVSRLYTINLGTGAATLVGLVGSGLELRGFALGLTAPTSQAMCSFTVTVQDTQAPTITCPANITQAAASGQCNAVVTYPAPTATDNCPGVTVSCTPPSGSTFAVGTTTVNCTASDTSANSPDASCSFTVTINDTQAPTITCPANITQAAASGQCNAVVNYPAPTVSDNCPGVTVTCTPPSGSTFVVGTTTVTCTASDTSANSPDASCSFTVTVNDTQAPTITCPANITRGNDPGQCNAVVTFTPTASDNCPGVTVTCVPPSGSTFAVGTTTTVTCTASDTSPSTPDATCSFTVTVQDTQAPTITCPTSFAVSADTATGSTVTFPAPTVSDNCPGVGTPVCTPASGSNFPVGATTVTCTVSDASPNSPDASCSFTITVNPTAAVGPGLPFPPTSEVSDQKAGSVLVYNLYSSSAAAPQTQNTRLSITNINPTFDIAVHLFFVDGATCSIADAIICLTKNQTATFLASDLDPGTTGYIVAVASNPTTGCPVNFNFLIGDAYVKLTSGHQANLGAEAFSALVGGLPACDANSLTATLNFDGVSYNRVPRTLAASSIPARNDGNDTLLVLNRFGGNLATGAATLTNLFGIFYDDAENAVSFGFSPGVCQFRSSLSNNFPRTTPRLETFIPAGRSGWLRLNSASDIGLLGAVLNFNPTAGTAAGAFNQGRNLHKLTLTSTQTLVIPIFPPNCPN